MVDVDDLWTQAVRLPRRLFFVLHEPETERYARAREYLKFLKESGKLLGQRIPADEIDGLEVALWAPPPDGRGPGFYFCVRLYFDEGKVSLARLFCFYDGSERSPGFRTLDAAGAFASSNGFMQVTT